MWFFIIDTHLLQQIMVNSLFNFFKKYFPHPYLSRHVPAQS